MTESQHPLPEESPETVHSLEELTQVYDYLIDTYGADSSIEKQETRKEPIDWSLPPRPRGLAAFKAVIFGNRPDRPILPPLPTYTETVRTVEMPISPARNPNDTRSATIFRRQSIKEAPVILFHSKSERSEAEAKTRHIGTETTDTHSGGVLYHKLGEDKVEAETGTLWFDYLSKVKEYRDSGEYDRSGYGPFIEQNIDLLRAVEEQMDLQEDDSEVQRNAKQEFDKEQINKSKQFIESWLADIPIPGWTHVEYDDMYTLYRWDYDTRSRKLQIGAVDGRLPTLSITESQSINGPYRLERRWEGLVTHYDVSLDTDDKNLMRYMYKGDFTPEHSSNPEPANKNQYIGELPQEILNQQVMDSINERTESFPNYAIFSLTTQALCNEVMAKYKEFEKLGVVTRVLDKQK